MRLSSALPLPKRPARQTGQQRAIAGLGRRRSRRCRRRAGARPPPSARRPNLLRSAIRMDRRAFGASPRARAPRSRGNRAGCRRCRSRRRRRCRNRRGRREEIDQRLGVDEVAIGQAQLAPGQDQPVPGFADSASAALHVVGDDGQAVMAGQRRGHEGRGGADGDEDRRAVGNLGRHRRGHRALGLVVEDGALAIGQVHAVADEFRPAMQAAQLGLLAFAVSCSNPIEGLGEGTRRSASFLPCSETVAPPRGFVAAWQPNRALPTVRAPHPALKSGSAAPEPPPPLEGEARSLAQATMVTRPSSFAPVSAEIGPIVRIAAIISLR
jgi:hypothetical protein